MSEERRKSNFLVGYQTIILKSADNFQFWPLKSTNYFIVDALNLKSKIDVIYLVFIILGQILTNDKIMIDKY